MGGRAWGGKGWNFDVHIKAVVTVSTRHNHMCGSRHSRHSASPAYEIRAGAPARACRDCFVYCYSCTVWTVVVRSCPWCVVLGIYISRRGSVQSALGGRIVT